MTDQQPIAEFFKALMHPVRLEILEMLRDGEVCVCHLEAATGYRQAYISQQLSVLRTAGLVQDRRDGWNMYYRVVEPRLFTVIDTARDLTGTSRSIHRRKIIRAAQCLTNCSCPRCQSETAKV